MCRIAYIPKNIFLTNKNKVLNFLNALEKSQGGDGNGVGFYTPYGVPRIKKSPEITNEELVRFVLNSKGINKPINGILYHTRLASAGDVSYVNTHPHLSQNHLLMLIHNGHWTFYTNYGYLNVQEQKEVEVPLIEYDAILRTYHIKGYEKQKKTTLKFSDSYIMAQAIERKIEENVQQGYDLEKATTTSLLWLYDTLGYDAVMIQFRNGDTYLVTKKIVQIGYIDGSVVIASESLHLLNADNITEFKGILKIINGEEGQYDVIKEEKIYYTYEEKKKYNEDEEERLWDMLASKWGWYL